MKAYYSAYQTALESHTLIETIIRDQPCIVCKDCKMLLWQTRGLYCLNFFDDHYEPSIDQVDQPIQSCNERIMMSILK